jgi:hypothetical protein
VRWSPPRSLFFERSFNVVFRFAKENPFAERGATMKTMGGGGRVPSLAHFFDTLGALTNGHAPLIGCLGPGRIAAPDFLSRPHRGDSGYTSQLVWRLLPPPPSQPDA